jgi:formylglycine-generating enzyme required for sulfatase activity
MKEADELYEKGEYKEAADAYRKIVRIYRVALDAVAPQLAAAVTADEKAAIEIGGGVRFDFVLIRPGTFTMGSVDGESDEQPMHSVTITRPFYLGTVEVTQRQWAQAMDADPSRFKGADMPVDSVSWYDCREFLKKLNEISPGHDFRLPTEAEWEYACRAGTTTRYWFGGDDMPMEPFAWVDTTSLNDPHPVGTLQPNPWGLYDMHGNLWEWCSDWHNHDYYRMSPSADPDGPEGGEQKVLRGGSFSNPGPYSRSANRGYFDPHARRNNYGFRIAWTVK